MHSKSHSFIVRIWNEAVEDGKSVWRGSIEKVGSDRKLYFSHLHDVTRFIQDQIGFNPSKMTGTITSHWGWIKNAITKNRRQQP